MAPWVFEVCVVRVVDLPREHAKLCGVKLCVTQPRKREWSYAADLLRTPCLRHLSLASHGASGGGRCCGCGCLCMPGPRDRHGSMHQAEAKEEERGGGGLVPNFPTFKSFAIRSRTCTQPPPTPCTPLPYLSPVLFSSSPCTLFEGRLPHRVPCPTEREAEKQRSIVPVAHPAWARKPNGYSHTGNGSSTKSTVWCIVPADVLRLAGPVALLLWCLCAMHRVSFQPIPRLPLPCTVCPVARLPCPHSGSQKQPLFPPCPAVVSLPLLRSAARSSSLTTICRRLQSQWQ